MRQVFFERTGTLSVNDGAVRFPRPDEIVVRTKSCGICHYDLKLLAEPWLDPGYAEAPGHEGVGIVEQVGADVQNLRMGDKVTCLGFGAFSEAFITQASQAARIPEDVEDYSYWISEPAACAVSALRLVAVEPGDTVVLIGCGYMGLLLLQGLPRNYLSSLIAVDVREDRLSLARVLGAEIVLNASCGDPVASVLDLAHEEVDVVIEASGVRAAIDQGARMLRNGGKLCVFGHHGHNEAVDMWTWHMKGLRVLNTTPYMSVNFTRDFQQAVRLMTKGVLEQRSLITHIYPFDHLGEALATLSSGRPASLIKAVVEY